MTGFPVHLIRNSPFRVVKDRKAILPAITRRSRNPLSLRGPEKADYAFG
jgi:hypothetical protein